MNDYVGDPTSSAAPEPSDIPAMPFTTFGHGANEFRTYQGDERLTNDDAPHMPREWEPGDPIYGRSGNYTRSLFQVLPYEAPMFMELAWCDSCDVFWSPWSGLHCWMCGYVVTHPADQMEYSRRERIMKERRQPWGR